MNPSRLTGKDNPSSTEFRGGTGAVPPRAGLRGTNLSRHRPSAAAVPAEVGPRQPQFRRHRGGAGWGGPTPAPFSRHRGGADIKQKDPP